jgi:hypothetical protein
MKKIIEKFSYLAAINTIILFFVAFCGLCSKVFYDLLILSDKVKYIDYFILLISFLVIFLLAHSINSYIKPKIK